MSGHNLGKDTPPHLKKQAFFSKIFLKRFTIFADCYENLRSTIFWQQHQDFREAETEVPRVRFYRKIQRRQIFADKYAVQQQKAGDDIQQTGKDPTCKPLPHQQRMVSRRPSRLRIRQDVGHRQAETRTGNPQLYQPLARDGHAFCPY